MTPQFLLCERLAELRRTIEDSSLDAAPSALGFASRMHHACPGLLDWDIPSITIEDALDAARYGGIPAIARAGYLLAQTDNRGAAQYGQGFLGEIARLRGRPGAVTGQILGDDLALLGIADGLNWIGGAMNAADARRWLASCVDATQASHHWTGRARLLAADLMDGRGRLKVAAPTGDVDAEALEHALRKVWPLALRLAPVPSDEQRIGSMTDLLRREAPVTGELERAVAWSLSISALAGEAATALVPTVDEVAAILRATQGALKRWPWEDDGPRGKLGARWLIDREAHVQAFLYAILYPRFGAALADEQYTATTGLVQPRIDFGIRDLKLVIEAKVVRNWSEASKVETEIREDCVRYFERPEEWSRMIVYIYDDADRSQAERYDSLRDALKRYDARILDVIFVRRPSALPSRARRVVTEASQ